MIDRWFTPLLSYGYVVPQGKDCVSNMQKFDVVKILALGYGSLDTIDYLCSANQPRLPSLKTLFCYVVAKRWY